MKQKFIWVSNVDSLTADSVVIHVWVGSSERDKKALRKVMEKSADLEAWFEKWDDHVDARLDYYQERVFWSSQIKIASFKTVSCTIHELLSMIRNDSLSKFEHSVCYPEWYLRFLWMAYPCSNLHPSSLPAKIHVPNPSRKYLSNECGSDATTVVRCSLAIMVLYILAAALQAIEGHYLGIM